VARRSIAPVDTIWLNMDRGDNLMVIESLMMTASRIDPDRLAAAFEERVVSRYPVFRQRPVDASVPWQLPHWEDDPGFDIARHLDVGRLPAPGDDRVLQDYIAGHLDKPLRRDRPLWEIHVLHGYTGAGDRDGSAVYTRLHHSMADGIALTKVLLSLTDASPDGTLVADDTLAPHHHHGWLELGGHLVGRLATPRRVVATARQGLGLTLRTTGVAAKLLLTTNPDSPIAGDPGPAKRAVWGEPVPLTHIKEVAHSTGTTVNDVVVAALAGALHTYQAEHGGGPVDVPTMVPVNLRPPDEPLPAELGNCFALVLLTLPSGLRTPFERLAETSRRMTAIKESPEAWLTFGMIRGIGRTGPTMERYLVDFFANKATGVTTNVPGPAAPCFLAGERVVAMMGWAPESGKQTLGTCIFSYNGRLHVGFKVDTRTIKDPQGLVSAFNAELVALRRLAPGRPPKAAARR
jgi:WS/DGAT/MGAT family acyltransferase